MALDEALLLLAREDRPTLRLYSWSPATVSLGYFQRRSDVPPWIARRFPLVRRSTGGGAIVHEEEEITFSLSGRAARRAPSPGEAAGLVLEGLRHALEPLGIRPRFSGGGGPSDPGGFFCGAIRRPQDIVVDLPGGPRKLVGTAQRRRGRAWLIHGGLPLARPPAEGVPAGEAREATVSEVLAVSGAPGPGAVEPPPDRGLRERLEEGLAAGFRRSLGMDLEPSPLEPEESRLGLRLLAERYTSPDWLAAR